MNGRSYTYDNNNRLTSAGGSSFGYDWVGNRLNPPANPNPMIYDKTDKLIRWPGQHQYAYDPRGNLQYQYDDASPRNLQKTFGYTPANLLSSVTHAGVNDPSEMVWDADGFRVGFTSSTGSDWDYVYDVDADVQAVVEEATDGGSVYYVRSPGGSLIARVSTSTQYYHFDGLGSARLLTGGNGSVTDVYSYDAWGNASHDSGSTAQPYQFLGQLGYYAHYQDANLTLLHLDARFYDPGIGRFTQLDPVHDGLNWYEYAGSSPIRHADPTGLAWIDDGKVCVDNSCWGSKAYEDVANHQVVGNVPSLGTGKDGKVAIDPLPEPPCPKGKPSCVNSDALYIVFPAPNVSISIDGGYWKRPAKNMLFWKIPAGFQCDVRCNGPRMSVDCHVQAKYIGLGIRNKIIESRRDDLGWVDDPEAEQPRAGKFPAYPKPPWLP